MTGTVFMWTINSFARCVFLLAIVVGPVQAHAETPLERGIYLVRGIAACGNCHTSRDADAKPIPGIELAGGNEFDVPIGHIVTPNITPDAETGVGRWTDEQITPAIRAGKQQQRRD